MSLTHTITPEAGIHAVALRGRLTEPSQAEGLMHDIGAVVSHEDRSRILLDLSGLEYMNSSGLNILIRLFTTVRNSGGEMVIGGISPKVSDLMVMTKLDSVFNIYRSKSEALAAFG